MPDGLELAISEALVRELPKVTPRRVRLPRLPGKVDAVIGMRRAGKTYLLLDEMASLPRDRAIFLSFEDERLLPMSPETLSRIPTTLHRLRPSLATGPIHWFFDEVHNVPGWERFVRRLVDEGHVVAVTGSSSRLLSREAATSLRGRGLATELLPFGFDEALRHAGLSGAPGRTTAERAILANRLRIWIDEGGFPEVQGLPPSLRIRLLQEYVDVAILRDVVERHAVTHVTALRWLVRRLLANPGSLFAVHRAHADLRSQGLSIGKDAIYALVEHLEDAFLVLLVPRIEDLERARNVHPRKVHLVDHGLASAFSFRSDVGHRLENAVYCELRRRGGVVAYAVTPGGREIDFVVEGPGGRSIVQVCADAQAPETRAREIAATDEAMAWLGVREATLVTLDESAMERTEHGVIRLVPAWEWLLDL